MRTQARIMPESNPLESHERSIQVEGLGLQDIESGRDESSSLDAAFAPRGIGADEDKVICLKTERL
jgi:hypothetical protein